MRYMENCRCLALALLIVVGWGAESRASVGAPPEHLIYSVEPSETTGDRTPF